jgi:hypothetical protein
MRAAAKIAVNYLAFHYPGIARMDAFADIRRFVRFGDWPLRAPVTVSEDAIIDDAPDNTRMVGHVIAVSWRPDSRDVIGQVSLFSWFQYRIVLSEGPFAIAPDCIASGHAFDPLNHEVVRLRHHRRQVRIR